MKKYFYLLAMAMLPMCFAACSSDDDDEGINAPVDGVWYLKSEVWHDWKNGGIDTSDSYEKTYDDNSRTWEFSMVNNAYVIYEKRSGTVRDTWSQLSPTEYRNRSGAGRDRVLIKSVTSSTMRIELYDGYFGENGTTGNTSELGVLSFSR